MSHDQRLGADPLDWIADGLSRPAVRPADTHGDRPADRPDARPDQPSGEFSGARPNTATGSVTGSQESISPSTRPSRPNIWRTLRPKGDAREFKAELSEPLDRGQVADMLEVLADAIRKGGLCLGQGDKAPALPFGESMDVEAEVSLKKDKARLRIELEWKNRKG